MANVEHVKLLKSGVEKWNKWREENPNVRPDLDDADLKGADLSGATLIRAYLIEADLSGADLKGATLTQVNLIEVNLIETYLSDTDLKETRLFKTVFANVDLSKAKNLETCRYGGPSTIDHGTLQKSGKLPRLGDRSSQTLQL